MKRTALTLSLLALLVSSCLCGDPADPAVIEILPGEPATVTVAPATVTLTAVGATARLSADVRDRNGLAVPLAAAWASSDVSVATVDSLGLVTAAGSGSATITARAALASGTAEVTVVFRRIR